jgi:hypothetical protein
MPAIHSRFSPQPLDAVAFLSPVSSPNGSMTAGARCVWDRRAEAAVMYALCRLVACRSEVRESRSNRANQSGLAPRFPIPVPRLALLLPNPHLLSSPESAASSSPAASPLRVRGSEEVRPERARRLAVATRAAAVEGSKGAAAAGRAVARALDFVLGTLGVDDGGRPRDAGKLVPVLVLLEESRPSSRCSPTTAPAWRRQRVDDQWQVRVRPLLR